VLRKFASTKLLEARTWDDNRRVAHRHHFTYEPREGHIYVRSRAISSRTNDNFDHFDAAEIKKAYRTFIGKPVFVNHHNADHRRARGVIIDAALHEDRLADGKDDTWVEVLMEVDAVRFPRLAQAILAGDIERTSMGCDVQYSECSFCGNKASTPSQYCRHIPQMKGQKIRRVTASGSREDVLVFEKCYGLSFFENSLLVEEPADPTAAFIAVDDRGVKGGYQGGVPYTAVAAKRQEVTVNSLQRIAQRKLAYGETVAPRQVSTLRDAACPVCGEVDGFDGERCATCGYFRPPEEFMDPDLTKAQEVDLRQKDEEVQEIDENGTDDGTFNLDDEDEDADDEDEEVDTEEGELLDDAEDDEPEDEDTASTLVEGDTHNYVPTSPLQETTTPLKGNVFELAKPPEEVPVQTPELTKDQDDSSEEDDDAEDSSDDSEDDSDESKKKPKKQSTRRNRGESMRPTLKALAEQQVMLDANQKAITRIAGLAGVKVDDIYATMNRRIAAMQRRADIDNPGQPVPEPPAESASQSTDEALGDLNDASVDAVGGVTTDDGTDTTVADVTQVGGVVEATDAETIDVTAPTTGAAFEDNDATLQADVTAESPSTDPMFPIDPAFAQRRVFAALRLARLRIQAGIASTDDDLSLGETIAKSAMSQGAIDHEIATLSQVQRSTARQASALAPAMASREVRRAVPSLGGVTSSHQPSATADVAALADTFLFD